MRIGVNGEEVEVPDSIGSVSDLLRHFDLQNKVVVVELNKQIVQQQAHSITALAEGDRVEIVHFVGGG
ncbi:sulfur carrier protein ThiS [Ferviditalea candida]|uniref:Sulfur carrier protein ThiS n=1 Tax=Ferviditalea candida TaxID=3108399 RepID=A0ABU5ZHJ3_9BACL|nr:sulfur carrier protein ThiS [Paenibacillaceae bacterium T2]